MESIVDSIYLTKFRVLLLRGTGSRVFGIPILLEKCRGK